VSQFTDLEILVIACNLILAIGCAIATLWVWKWRRRLVILNLVLEHQIREIDRILDPAPGQIIKNRQVIAQLRQIYQRQRSNWDQLRQIALLVGVANTIARKRKPKF
jgi:hypothetical protein